MRFKKKEKKNIKYNKSEGDWFETGNFLVAESQTGSYDHDT